MDSEKMLKTKLPKGMVSENQARLGSKPNWKIVPANIDKYPSFAIFCDECGSPYKDGKISCNCQF